MKNIHKTLRKLFDNKFVKLGKQAVIRFRNYSNQLAVRFKIYADFESLLKGVKSSDKNDASYTEKYQSHIPCSFAYKVVCIDNKFSKPVVLYKRKNAVYKFIETILIERSYSKKIIKKHFNLKLTKKVPVIFLNLRGYDSHLIMQEIGKFDVKVSVIPNGLEKYMAFTINSNLVFIDSM